MFLGVGVLGLPHTFVAAGLGLGAIFLLLGGIVAVWSLQILVRSSNHLKISNYSDLVTHVLGSVIILQTNYYFKTLRGLEISSIGYTSYT